MFSPDTPFTPEGYVSLDAALVVVFAVAMQDASNAASEDRDDWRFQMAWQRHAPWRVSRMLYPGIPVIASRAGETKRLCLRPPLRDLLPEHREYREYFCSDEVAEVAHMVRRALSSGGLRSFLIGDKGDMLPLPARFWNTDVAEALFTGEAAASYEAENGSCGPEGVFLLVDELDAWLAILFDSYDAPGPPEASGKTDPVQACVAWLSDEMKRSPSLQPRPKRQLRDEAMAKFEGLAWRAFETAWSIAKANNPTATGWGQAGRKAKFAAKSAAKSAAK
jgi:hypothetical protein